MSFKSVELYKEAFNDIIIICRRNNINLDLKDIIIMCDFEKSLRTSIISVLEGVKFKGCYFHYVKGLWTKAKRIGLANKTILDKNYNFYFKTINIIKFRKA